MQRRKKKKADLFCTSESSVMIKKKNTCCKSELSKIVHSALARCYVCRKTSISQLIFFFFLPRREAAVLAAERQCSRAGVSWEVAEGNGGMLNGVPCPSVCLAFLSLAALLPYCSVICKSPLACGSVPWSQFSLTCYQVSGVWSLCRRFRLDL